MLVPVCIVLGCIAVAAIVAATVFLLRARRAECLARQRSDALRASPMAYLLLDGHRNILEYNAAMSLLFPAMADIPCGTAYSSIKGLPPLPHPLCRQTAEYTSAASGKKRKLRVQTTPVGHAQPGAVCLHIWDITQQRELEKQLESYGCIDCLTGLLNAESFLTITAHCFKAMRAAEGSAAAIVLEVDSFLQLCHTHGAAQGGKVFALSAGAAKSILRSHDLAGRYRENRIAIFLPGCDAYSAQQLAHSILEEIAQIRPQWGGTGITVSASAGVAAMNSRRHSTAEHLLEEAAAALYTAKAIGSGTVFLGGPQQRGTSA